jgi:hypothetical protein
MLSAVACGAARFADLTARNDYPQRLLRRFYVFWKVCRTCLLDMSDPLADKVGAPNLNFECPFTGIPNVVLLGPRLGP